MEISEKEYTKASPCEKMMMDDEDESEFEEMNESFDAKDGGSSSNSTVEESGEKKPSVRPYVRSKMPRLRWTPDLHLRFIHAVERLGGQETGATPKLVLQLMGIKGLNIAHVKSHLQMYRSKKTDESNQGVKDHRMFMEGVDRNIFNLGQLPLHPNFNLRPNSNLRYGDPTWNSKGQWMHNSAVGLNNARNNITRSGFYTERNSSNNHYTRPLNLDYLSSRFPSLNHGTPWRNTDHFQEGKGLLHKHEPWLGQSKQNPIEIDSLKLQIQQKIQEKGLNPPIFSQILSQEREKGLKRKASDAELDLNLSLGLESRNGDEDNEEDGDDGDDEHLALSLFTVPDASKKMKKGGFVINVGDEKARGASTLDLTL